MKCEQCNKHEATVLFRHIVESKKRTTRLCSSCASKIEGIDAESPHAGDKKPTVSAINSDNSTSAEVCPTCGATYEDFKKTGRLSCADCYVTFETQVDRLLKRLHGAVKHCGKQKISARHLTDLDTELETLKTELGAAVEEEAFERAAEIRDRIKKMEEETVDDNTDQNSTNASRFN